MGGVESLVLKSAGRTVESICRTGALPSEDVTSIPAAMAPTPMCGVDFARRCADCGYKLSKSDLSSVCPQCGAMMEFFGSMR